MNDRCSQPTTSGIKSKAIWQESYTGRAIETHQQDSTRPAAPGKDHTIPVCVDYGYKSLSNGFQTDRDTESRKRRLEEESGSPEPKIARTDQVQKDVTSQITVCKRNEERLSESITCAETKRTLRTVSHTEENTSLHISDLPVAMLLKTFTYLSMQDLIHGVSVVNNSWHSLAHDPSLWRRICLRKIRGVTDRILFKLTTLSENVQYLDISDLRSLTSDGVAVALQNCAQLHTLKMLRCMHLQSPVFHSLGEHCPSMQQLFIDGCNSISDNDLKKIAAGCPKLELLRINQCHKITTEGIQSIAENCPHLRQLTMDQCTKVTDEAIVRLVENCHNLQEISCMSCNLTDDGVELLAKAKELRFMEVSNIRSVTNKSIMKVIKNCIQLESINVSLCTSINDVCVDFMARHVKHLKKVYLVSCDLTDEALISIGKHSKIMEIVDVGWCSAITDRGVRAISKSCPTLRYLGLMRCDQVTIPATEELVVQYPHITYSTKWLDCKRLLDRAVREGASFSKK